METSLTPRPALIPGYEKQQALHAADLESRRWGYPLRACAMVATGTAKRVQASREEFPWAFFRGDFHSHTQHSDAIGTVAETAEMVQAAGLDFQFVTDHWGITQAPECREHGLWVGQEPVTAQHHLGILGLEHAFVPQMDFLTDYHGVMEQGATVFVPHPTGWWPDVVYGEEQKKILEELPSPFLMEICNGANNIVSAFDYTDDTAITLWDHLLSQGKVVHALGNTDAHLPHAIGMVWNSVFADSCQQSSIIEAVCNGRSFVSDAPLVHIALGAARMGGSANASDRKNQLKITAVDSRGLNSVAVVADGEEIFYRHFRGDTSWNGEITIPQGTRHYVRVAVRSDDGRRAYSNPIYLSA